MTDSTIKRLSDYHGFLAGLIAGWCGVLTSQPFDLVKVRLQSSSQALNVVQVVRSILVYEGLGAYWKGTLAPLIGSGIGNSINIGTLEYAKKKIREYNNGEPLSLKQHALAGALSGVFTTFVFCPFELFRVKMQLQGVVKCPGEPHYKSTYDAIRKIIRIYGIKGIRRSFPITYLREIYGNAIFYFTYQFSLLHLAGDKERKTWQILLSGGFSGIAYWLSIFPLDLVKSRIQADSLCNPYYTSARHCLRETLQKEGVRSLYKGLLPCLVRSFPVSGIYLYSYETVMRFLSNIDI